MRFMLLQNYGEIESNCPPMTEWTFRAAAARTTNLREQHYLTKQAARIASERADA